METKLTFDDVGLSPVHNNVESRMTPKLDTWLAVDTKIKMPLLAANMDCVIGSDLARILINHGGMPIFHRFCDLETQINWLKEFGDECFLSSGLDCKDLPRLVDNGLRGVCFDVAQGHDVRLYEAIAVARTFGLEVIAGNVCTEQGYIDLVNAGATSIKVGIGPGAACTTRTVTGFGVPQMSALLDIRPASLKYKIPYIADGGIRTSGDAVKALAAGASSIMMGRQFAATWDSAAWRQGDLAYYSGQAAKEYQREGRTPEGEGNWIPTTTNADTLIKTWLGGIRSGLTYGGSTTIKEFQKKVLIHNMIFRTTEGYRAESSTRL